MRIGQSRYIITLSDQKTGVSLEVNIDFTEEALAAYEWVEEGHHIREFLIPAVVFNSKGVVRVADGRRW